MRGEKQKEYLLLYQSGWTMREIAFLYGVNISTISRTIKRSLRKTCPFASDCENCPLPDCAFKDEYAYLVNNLDSMPDMRRKRNPRGEL